MSDTSANSATPEPEAALLSRQQQPITLRSGETFAASASTVPHVNYAWSRLERVKYERHPAGPNKIAVAQPNARKPIDHIEPHLLLKTRALETTRAVHSHCAHYRYNDACVFGAECRFIHAVHLDPSAKPYQKARIRRQDRNNKQQQQQQLQAANADANASNSTDPDCKNPHGSSPLVETFPTSHFSDPHRISPSGCRATPSLASASVSPALMALPTAVSPQHLGGSGVDGVSNLSVSFTPSSLVFPAAAPTVTHYHQQQHHHQHHRAFAPPPSTFWASPAPPQVQQHQQQQLQPSPAWSVSMQQLPAPLVAYNHGHHHHQHHHHSAPAAVQGFHIVTPSVGATQSTTIMMAPTDGGAWMPIGAYPSMQATHTVHIGATTPPQHQQPNHHQHHSAYGHLPVPQQQHHVVLTAVQGANTAHTGWPPS